MTRLRYYIPPLITLSYDLNNFFRNLSEEPKGEPFPFLLDIIDTVEYQQANLEVISKLEFFGLKRGEFFEIRQVPQIFDQEGRGYWPRLVISKENPFGLDSCFLLYTNIIEYLERSREEIQVGLAKFRDNPEVRN